MPPSVHAPVGASAGALTPAQVKKLFEFFTRGTHREVLLLGDLVEQYVHRVKSKGYNVLCGARAGLCELCDRAAESDDIGVQRAEYYAPAFVRSLRDREFQQRVAVFSAASAEKLLALIPDGARGKRVDIKAVARGNSVRYELKQLPGLPAGFPAVLPAAFDVTPFILARYGKPTPRPLVLLDPFKCEPAAGGPAGRPKPLALTADDCKPAEGLSGDELKAMLRQRGLVSDKAPKAAAPKPGVKVDAPDAGPVDAGGLFGAILARAAGVTDPAEEYAEEVTQPTGSTISREQKARSPFLNGQRKGGAA